MRGLRRYWFTFTTSPRFNPLSLGCGITGFDRIDAMRILERVILARHPGMEVAAIREDVDVSTLDAGHVLPNLGQVSVRGVWFPLGYVLDRGD